MTIAICSNRPAQLARILPAARRAVGEADRILVVLDTGNGFSGGRLEMDRVDYLNNDRNRGLVYSRNRVMKECVTRHVVFVDDDVVVDSRAIESLRAALASGASVVGARITADFGGKKVPWFVSAGQLHYLGSHDPNAPASTWGGCFGVDVESARLFGVDFDERLGRFGWSLNSGEDTTFVRRMRSQGVVEVVLDEPDVRHLIAPDRLRLRYLIRRAYWQGRSEVRRRDVQRGVLKEWRRNTRSAGFGIRRSSLAMLYMSAVVAGAVAEAARSWCCHQLR
ncbi:MAG: glycosyltransferase [Pseudonocardiaceae bacterium]